MLDSIKNSKSFSRLNPKLRIKLLIANLIPCAVICAAALIAYVAVSSLALRLAVALGVIYVMPPLLARAIIFFWRPPTGRMSIQQNGFICWWVVFQLEMLFSRLPILEELLRLFPGLYSFWLRCWGANIGSLVFWSPGVIILDRPWLKIGDDVLLGAGVRIAAHLFYLNAEGEFEFVLESANIESRAVVGGYSMIGPGASIANDEVTRGGLILPPYARFENGRKVKK